MAAVDDERCNNEGITVAWVIGSTLEVFKFDFHDEGKIAPIRSWELGHIGKNVQVRLLQISNYENLD